MRIQDIKIGTRYRHDLGDVQALADSMSDVGLLHPIVVNTRGELIAGARRLAAAQLLGWEDIPATVVPLDEIVRGEMAENTHRKDFLPSEAVAIAAAVRELESPRARERQSVGWGDHSGGGKLPQPELGKTRDKAASYVGISGRTLEKAEAVVQSGNTELIELMDRTGKVDRAYKAIAYGHIAGDEWYTPRWLFDALAIKFSIDVCAPEDLTHVTTPATKYFTPADDGLKQKWHGTIWCNPPYSEPEPWALRCVEHGDGLLLTHIPMNAEWCAKVWDACDAIRLFQAIEFVRPDGITQRPGTWLQLAAFGTKATNALANLKVPSEIAINPRRVPSPMWVKA